MEAIKFTISGKNAFFKNPIYSGVAGKGGELQYFSFNNIHKIAVLGILGATIGLSGYGRGNNNPNLPDFYLKLKDLEIAIVPNSKSGYFSTTSIKLNNSSKLASRGEANDGTKIGTILNYKQNWLVNPSWDIYIKQSDNQYYTIIKDYLINSKTEFTRYLGSNSHLANIKNVEIVEINKIDKFNGKVDSLFFSSNNINCRKITIEEYPIKLNPSMFYEYQTLYFTNENVIIDNIYNDGNKNIYFLEPDLNEYNTITSQENKEIKVIEKTSKVKKEKSNKEVEKQVNVKLTMQSNTNKTIKLQDIEIEEGPRGVTNQGMIKAIEIADIDENKLNQLYIAYPEIFISSIKYVPRKLRTLATKICGKN